MNVLSLIGRNFRRGPETLRLPGRQAPAPGFRGLVRNQPERCLGCGICDYVCVSAAITVTDHEDHCDWEYDPGRCTFCGRCVAACPGAALTQEPDRAPVYAVAGELRTVLHVAYPPCPRCGRPSRPVTDTLRARAFTAPSDELRRRTLLCERCRLRYSQSVLKAGVRRLDAALEAAPERPSPDRLEEGDDRGP